MNSSLALQKDESADKEIKIFNFILAKCFKKCANNFYTNTYVNEENECLTNCAKKLNEYLNEIKMNFHLDS